MKTSNLTWNEAVNLLHSGMCKKVRIMKKPGIPSNIFYLDDSVVMRQFVHTGNSYPVGASPCKHPLEVFE